MKIERWMNEKQAKKSYFDKKRHFIKRYIVDYQPHNNFKKKREGVDWGASTIHILRPFSQVSF